MNEPVDATITPHATDRDDRPDEPLRIHVVGTSGSGKTTFARALARRVGAVHVELDDLSWGPNWQERPHDAVRADLTRILEREPRWVVDGNYSYLRTGAIWPYRPLVIWLDYSFVTVMRRVIWRTLGRSITRRPLWQAGNRESVGRAFFSRDSILLWAATTYRRRRARYGELFDENPQLSVVRFARPRHAARWLERVNPNSLRRLGPLDSPAR